MKDLVIRKFEHTDVEAFIRLSQTSFAEESLAAGITLEDFALETRRIFRWKMIPYKLLTALMSVRWEAFVAEVDGRVVGGGMYIGRKDHMTLTNLMVDPAYRRQGVGQALLVKRLERLAVRGFPIVTAQVLETNTASLENLKKQGFEIFHRYSVYERALPLPASWDETVTVRDITHSDRTLFSEIEKRITPPSVLQINGSAATHYFQSGWQKVFARFTGYSRWSKAVIAQGKTVGFLHADFHRKQRKGYLLQPMLLDEHLPYLPAMIRKASAWLAEAGKEAMVVEVSDHRTLIHDTLIQDGWEKQHTWCELVKWLEEGARKTSQER